MISDVIDFGITVEQPRGELWQLLATPLWYPRFFRGVGVTNRVFDPDLDRTEAYSARVGDGHILTGIDVRFRVREQQPGEKLMIEGDGWFASIRFADEDPVATRISAALFKIKNAHAEVGRYDNVDVTTWLRDGILRAADYLAGAQTSTVRNDGELPTLALNVAKKMVTSKVLDVFVRPDRGFNQLNSLARLGFTLAGGYSAAQAHSPTRAAIIDEVGVHTFERVHLRSQWLAAGLTTLGISAGEAVGVLARNHAAMVEAMVACGKLGVDAVLINVGLAAIQIEEIARRQQLSAIFVDDEFDNLVHYLPEHVIRIATRADTVIRGRITVQDLVGCLRGSGKSDPSSSYPKPPRPGKIIVLTSGTSGAPKAAMRPSPKGFTTVAAMLSRLPLQMNERMLLAAPLFHSWGLGLLQISTPVRATVVLQNRFDPEACLQAIAQHRCTALLAVPVMLQRILDLPAAVRARHDTSTLRIIASSGSSLPGTLSTQIMDTFGDILYNFYGSTEVSWASVADPADLRAAPATAGRPHLGTRIAIRDDQGAVMPVGAVGRIFVGNEMLFDGYLNATDPRVVDDTMDTGDLGYLDADGRLFICGRDDEMIISGGENVFPRPVEDALAALPQISEVAVIGVPDQEWGQRLAAFVVPCAGATLEVEMLRHYIRNRLSRFSVPRDFTFLESLPRSATGKILKRVLVRGDFDLA